MASVEVPCDQRRSGILAPIFSLDDGRFGDAIIRFLDFLHRSGNTVWQILPIGPTMADGSPYNSSSSFAINPEFLSLDWLESEAGFRPDVPVERRRHGHGASAELARTFERFRQSNADWLDDFALFMAIRHQHDQAGWQDWPVPLRDRDPEALGLFRARHADLIQGIAFEQFLLDRQWQRIVDAAQARGVLIYGDLPIFVALDSADVWANPGQFQLDSTGLPRFVAGVPPDYFSETGQRWGNPLFDWPMMQDDRFLWWRRRFARQLKLFDWVRIDHFRGLEAYWSIPADAETAIAGQWVPAPGEALLAALQEEAGGILPVIAEDLGVITEDVTVLRQSFGLPGMCILQFAFDGSPDNPYLPDRHSVDSVVYTGTHDNDTTLGWWQNQDQQLQQRARRILREEQGIDEAIAMPHALIQSALHSRAGLAIIPLMDWLQCDSRCRINVPGTSEGNWRWRCPCEELDEKMADRIRSAIVASNRLPG